MTVLIMCLLIACLLPMASKLPLAFAQAKSEGGYDNNDPRKQQAKLEGFGARAHAAHQNSFEALAVFAPAVLLAIASGHVDQTMQTLAMIFIVARLVYNVVYIKGLGKLRSMVWFVAYGSAISMIWMCLP